MRHPRDSEASKRFDLLHPEFANDPRNVRLGLASDGFNPFGNMSTSHSIWPVVLIPYNRPPWECMKQTSFDTKSSSLYRGKFSYMGHRCVLQKDHKFRSNQALFNGRTERRDAPIPLTRAEIFKQVEDLNVTFGKQLETTNSSKRSRTNNVEVVGAP